MNYKSTLRIPTQDTYAYIEVQVEGEPEDIVAAYREFMTLVKPQTGLGEKEYKAALDTYLTNGTGVTETYLAMSPEQQRVFQEIKKSLARIKSRNGDKE